MRHSPPAGRPASSRCVRSWPPACGSAHVREPSRAAASATPCRYGGDEVDLTQGLRNWLTYNLYRAAGRYASRTVYCEVRAGGEVLVIPHRLGRTCCLAAAAGRRVMRAAAAAAAAAAPSRPALLLRPWPHPRRPPPSRPSAGVPDRRRRGRAGALALPRHLHRAGEAGAGAPAAPAAVPACCACCCACLLRLQLRPLVAAAPVPAACALWPLPRRLSCLARLLACSTCRRAPGIPQAPHRVNATAMKPPNLSGGYLISYEVRGAGVGGAGLGHAAAAWAAQRCGLLLPSLHLAALLSHPPRSPRCHPTRRRPLERQYRCG